MSAVAAGLLDREFDIAGPGIGWVTDLIYIGTYGAGFFSAWTLVYFHGRSVRERINTDLMIAMAT